MQAASIERVITIYTLHVKTKVDLFSLRLSNGKEVRQKKGLSRRVRKL